MYLGTLIDAEADGIPDAGAQGDDNDNNDDEDGVVFTSSLYADSTATVSVTASISGLLSGWIDFDQNGTWDTPSETVFSDQALTAGTNALTFTVPGSAHAGATYARFRFTKSTIVDPQGFAPDGEVEDYAVEIEEVSVDSMEYDFGDAPSPYPTTRSDHGAYHAIDSVFMWGDSVDSETDGQPDTYALGDDNNNIDDEEGTISIVGGTILFNQSLPVVAGAAVKAGIWLDWDRDSSWTNNGFHMTAVNLTPFDMSLDFGLVIFNLPLTSGTYNLRLRCYQDTSIAVSDTGYGGVGEVEDYQVQYTEQVVDYDYGDAPLPYPTQLETGTVPDDGWRHPIDDDVYLGQSVDSETDGQPDEDAAGDVSNGNSGDDGVVFSSSLVAGQTANLQVTASIAGYLNGFIDYNQDDDWDDTDDQVFSEEPLTAGVNNLSFTVPSGVRTGETFARFRFSTRHLYKSFQKENAYYAKDGEVEDYKVTIQSTDDDNGEPDDSTSGFMLYSNRPNPFITNTQISYALPQKAFMTLAIYNVQGEFVAALVSSVQESGLNQATWDGKNSSGNDVASGTYLCKMKTSGYENTVRMLLLR